MAFDISLGEAPQVEASPNRTFDGFYDAEVDAIGTAIALSCDDGAVTDRALLVALVGASQRWRYLRHHSNPVGWALQAGLVCAEKALRDHPPAAVNTATGGYTRGLALADAMAALPLTQRASLVTAYLLGWNDDYTAAGFEVGTETITTRRTRALTFLGHHLRVPTVEVEAAVTTYLAELAAACSVKLPDAVDVRRRGRLRSIRNRTAAAILAIGLIVAGGAALQVENVAPVVVGPDTVPPPSASGDWFAPVSDGKGGYVALNTSGAARFIRSGDGLDWFEAATWNSRAVDLRGRVTRFVRSGDRYLATIEATSGFATSVTPYVATSLDLDDWTVQQLGIESPKAVDGLQSRHDVLGIAASGPVVLVSVQTTWSIDHQAFGVRPDDVCVETTTAEALIFSLCDGASLEVPRPATNNARPRYFVSNRGGPFNELEPPTGVDGRSIVGFDDGFVDVDSTTGEVWLSVDAQTWRSAGLPDDENRFVVLAVGPLGGALVIEPHASGWTSTLVDIDGTTAQGELPIALDPSTVWTAPEVATGPAGSAVFVTTARPWERTDVTPGWAVDTGQWIVSRLPDSVLISARSADGATSHRFIESADHVTIDDDGTVRLMVPGESNETIEVTVQQIADSRQTTSAQRETKAQVFFSPDGETWRSIWQSAEDSWFGSVAVGDDEVLISGASLIARPFTVALDGPP